MRKSFVSTMRKGFQMTFANGYTISVQWGAGNYCENHDSFLEMSNPFGVDAEANHAEIAIWKDGSRDFIDPQNFIDEEISSEGEGGVAGWVTAEQVAAIMFNLSKA